MIHRRFLITAALAGVLVMSGCGDDGGGSEGGDSPIQLSAFGVQESQALSFPELEPGAQAAIKSINAAGGVKGRDLELEFCNDGGDPNKAATCARDIAASDSVAVVGSLTFGGSQAVPIFEAAKLADIAPNPISPIEYQSKNVFLIDGGTLSVFGSLPKLAESLAGAKKLAILYEDNPAKAANEVLIKNAVEATGQEIVKTVTVPATTPDVAPFINQIKASDADILVAIPSPPNQAKVWQAAKSVGLGIPIISGTGGASPSAIKAAGGAADGSFVSSQFPTVDADLPGLQDFRDDMKKYEPDATLDSVSLRAWASVKLFAEVAEGIDGDITREAVLKALGETKDLDFLWIGKLSFDQPGAIKGYERVVAPYAYPLKIEKGEYVDAGERIDLSQ